MRFVRPQSARVRQIGEKLFGGLQKNQSTGLSLDKYLMELAFRDSHFKTALLHFVDVLPSLSSAKSVREHFSEQVLPHDQSLSWYLRALLHAGVVLPFAGNLFSKLVALNVSHMATRFIAGKDTEAGVAALQALHAQGIAFTADILGEMALTPSEALANQKKYQDLLTALADGARVWRGSVRTGQLAAYDIPLVNLSVKASSLTHLIRPADFDGSRKRLINGLMPLFEQAKSSGAFINIDMEQNDYRPIIMAAAEEIFCGTVMKNYPHVGIVCQAYLKNSLNDLEHVHLWAKSRGAPITVRLVKGAYWDYEVAKSRQRGWEMPVFENKEQTDAHYEKCTEYLLGAWPDIRPAFASHNVRSLAYALAACESCQLPEGGSEVQVLHGMAAGLAEALKELGVRVRVYAPLGPLLPGMAYLVRRLLENTSNQGFLAGLDFSKMSIEDILKDPAIHVSK